MSLEELSQAGRVETGTPDLDWHLQLIIQHLTEKGLMPAERLYESPFTDAAPQGPDALFPSADVDNIITILKTVHANATSETTVA